METIKINGINSKYLIVSTLFPYFIQTAKNSDNMHIFETINLFKFFSISPHKKQITLSDKYDNIKQTIRIDINFII